MLHYCLSLSIEIRLVWCSTRQGEKDFSKVYFSRPASHLTHVNYPNIQKYTYSVLSLFTCVRRREQKNLNFIFFDTFSYIYRIGTRFTSTTYFILVYDPVSNRHFRRCLDIQTNNQKRKYTHMYLVILSPVLRGICTAYEYNLARTLDCYQVIVM